MPLYYRGNHRKVTITKANKYDIHVPCRLDIQYLNSVLMGEYESVLSPSMFNSTYNSCFHSLSYDLEKVYFNKTFTSSKQAI